MRLGPSPDVIRQRIVEQCAAANISLAQLSRILGRRDPYIARFVREAVPYELPLADRAKAAEYFGIPGPHLGAPAGRDERRAFAQRMRQRPGINWFCVELPDDEDPRRRRADH